MVDALTFTIIAFKVKRFLEMLTNSKSGLILQAVKIHILVVLSKCRVKPNKDIDIDIIKSVKIGRLLIWDDSPVYSTLRPEAGKSNKAAI